MQREIDDLRHQLKLTTQANASNSSRAPPEGAISKDPDSETTTRTRQLSDTELAAETVDRLFKE